VFVRKEIDGTGLMTPSSLAEMTGVLAEVSRLIVPVIEQPHYTALECLHVIESYVRTFGGDGLDFGRIAQGIVRAVDTVNALAREASEYARIGAEATRLSIAVYGSAGRLESRPDSDIEFSVFPEGNDPEALQRGVSLWNRMFMFCERRGLKPEGASIVDRNSPRLLRVADVGEFGRNGYAPVLPASWLIEEKSTRVANLRNRHRQLLFESRAVFNGDALNRLKRAVLDKYVMKGGKDVLAVFGSPYWERVLGQFDLDAGLEGFRKRADIKTFCYRTMGVFATRLFLIEQIMFAAQGGFTLTDWDDAKLESMCRPAFLKLLGFCVRCGDRDRAMMGLMRDLITAFGNLLVRMDGAGYKGDEIEDDSLIQNCAEDARRTAEAGARLIAALESHPSATALKMRPWLLKCPEFGRLVSQQ
jgi:predicted nucleotidyltransferase